MAAEQSDRWGQAVDAFGTPETREVRPSARAARSAHAFRLATTGTGLTLAFDAAVFAAMFAMGWKLVMPWGDAMTPGEGLMGMGLLVCAGLWTSISADDLHRWRKLHRRWHAQALSRSTAPVTAPDPVALPAAVVQRLANGSLQRGLRVRSIVRPSRPRAAVATRSPWSVVKRIV